MPPKKINIHVEGPSQLEALSEAVIHHLTEVAKAGPVDIKLQHNPAKPFTVVSMPGGGVMWGVGGCGIGG